MGLLPRYAKLRIAHAPGMPGTFSPPPRVSDPDMHQGTCVTHVPWCMPGSLTSSFLQSRWRGKFYRHSRCMRNPQFYVSVCERPIESRGELTIRFIYRSYVNVFIFYIIKVGHGITMHISRIFHRCFRIDTWSIELQRPLGFTIRFTVANGDCFTSIICQTLSFRENILYTKSFWQSINNGTRPLDSIIMWHIIILIVGNVATNTRSLMSRKKLIHNNSEQSEYLWNYWVFRNYVGHYDMFEISENIVTIYRNIFFMLIFNLEFKRNL